MDLKPLVVPIIDRYLQILDVADKLEERRHVEISIKCAARGI